MKGGGGSLSVMKRIGGRTQEYLDIKIGNLSWIKIFIHNKSPFVNTSEKLHVVTNGITFFKTGVQ